MTRTTRLYLPKSAWPEVDQSLWDGACVSGTDPFEDHGPAAHLSPRTRLQLEYAYGKFLVFVSDRHPELLKRPPAERLSRNIIEDYVSWQPKTCGGVTLATYLYHLWLILRYICSNDDWPWLLTVSKRIAAQAKRKPEKHHLVTSGHESQRSQRHLDHRCPAVSKWLHHRVPCNVAGAAPHADGIAHRETSRAIRQSMVA
jgi:hypothetical protein